MNTFFISIKRELRYLAAHPRYLLLLTLGLAFSYLFFVTLMGEGQPQRLPIAIVDHDGSYVSRRLSHEINAMPGVEVVEVFDNHQQARKAMQGQQIYAFFEIPKGFYSNILAFKAPKLSLYSSNAYLLPGALSYKSLATVGKLAAAAVQREVLRKKGYTEKQVMGIIQPVEMDAHSISNPTANYQPYVLTTVLPGILGVMVLLFTIYIVSNERKHGTLRELESVAGGNMFVALAAKLLPYTLWFSVLGIVGNVVLFYYCHYTMLGSFVMLSLLTVLFVVVQQSLAVFLVALVPEQHMSICIGAIYGMLSFTMSGFSFPVTSMIPFLQGFSYIFPLRHYYLTYVDLALYGNRLDQYWIYIVALFVFVIMGFVGAGKLHREAAESEYEIVVESSSK